MDQKKTAPKDRKVGNKPGMTDKKITGTLEDNNPAPHVGTSDAFSRTESTDSPDADGISDEKIDELVDDD